MSEAKSCRCSLPSSSIYEIAEQSCNFFNLHSQRPHKMSSSFFTIKDNFARPRETHPEDVKAKEDKLLNVLAEMENEMENFPLENVSPESIPNYLEFSRVLEMEMNESVINIVGGNDDKSDDESNDESDNESDNESDDESDVEEVQRTVNLARCVIMTTRTLMDKPNLARLLRLYRGDQLLVEEVLPILDNESDLLAKPYLKNLPRSALREMMME